jgi:hypothetical protein
MMLKSIFRKCIFVLTILLGGTPLIAAASDLAVIDQENVPTNMSGLLFPYFSVGQEFTPELAGLDTVVLWSRYGPASDTTVQVVIRRGTITGPVMGASLETPLTAGWIGEIQFEFPSLVFLMPGSVYVIELLSVDGDDWFVQYDNNGSYPDGRMITNGTPSDGIDLWFQEGLIDTVPHDRKSCMDDLWSVMTRTDGSIFENQGLCIRYVNTGF